MVDTLRHIAARGADDFYTGELGGHIASDMMANGALLSAKDLSDYQTCHCTPLSGNYRKLGISTNHPPGGGIMLIQMLNILENFDLRDVGPVSYTHLTLPTIYSV